MINNEEGYTEVEQFIDELKKRNLTVKELILLHEQYERYNSIAKREVDESFN